MPTQAGGGARVAAIIVAAGEGRRMGGVDKVLAPLMGRPLVAHSLQVFSDCPLIDEVVLVMSLQNVEEGRRLVEEYGWRKVREVCAGGERRQESVRRGLEGVQDTQWVVVHDGARPCVDEAMIARGLEAAEESGAAVAGVPVNDTIKSAGQDMVVTRTVSREGLWVVQTPQVFRTELLSRAHRSVAEEVTDDASMVELIGGRVRIFSGSRDNAKVTTPSDIPIAEAILRARSVARGGE